VKTSAKNVMAKVVAKVELAKPAKANYTQCNDFL